MVILINNKQLSLYSKKKTKMSSHIIIKKKTSTSLLCELSRLKSQQNYLENTQPSLMLELPEEDAKLEKDILVEIERQQIELEENFKNLRINAKYDSNDIQESLTDFKTNMLTDQSLKTTNVIKYRETVIAIDRKISDRSIELKISLEKLKAEQREIETSMLPYEIILQDIPKPNFKICQDVKKTFLSKSISETDCSEVKIFDKFLLVYGGHTGGWNDEEHCIFLKYKNKYKSNLDRIITCFKDILPSKV